MRATKFIDTAKNVYYVKGERSSLVKVRVVDTPYKGIQYVLFFEGHENLNKWLSENQGKKLVSKGCFSTGLSMGNSGGNHVYDITKSNI